MKSFVVGLLLVACSKEQPKQAPAPTVPTAVRDASLDAAPQPEWYKVVFGEKQGTAIPVFLQIPPTGDEALFPNGAVAAHAAIVSRPPNLELTFDIYHTKISAKAGAGGTLEGTFDSTSGSWGSSSLSFTAEPIARPDPSLRFPSKPGGPDPVGVWKVQLSDQLGKLEIRRGQGDEIVGTFGFQSGNMAVLAGAQEGNTLRMSSFDGTSPYVLFVDIDAANKTLKGTWVAGQSYGWKEDVTAQRTNDFELKLAPKLVGKHPKLAVPQLAQAPYLGNPVIVELGGSWCAACGYAARFLKTVKEKYGKDGLQVLTLAYEFSDDSAYNKAQAQIFQKKYDVPWEIVPVDGGLEKYAEILPKELSGVDAAGFPIAIFVNRDGTIEDFHTGFPSDAAGASHDKTVAEYERLAAAIVASKPRK